MDHAFDDIRLVLDTGCQGRLDIVKLKAELDELVAQENDLRAKIKALIAEIEGEKP